jgi:flagellar protein FlgJ
MLNVQHADVYTDFNGLAKLKTEAKEKTPEAIKEVAKQFESIFLSRVLKTMRQAKLAEDIMGSDQSQFYRDMYDQQLAVHLSGDPGIGLADLIVKQLSPEKANHEGHQEIDDYLNRSISTANASKPQQTKSAGIMSDGRSEKADLKEFSLTTISIPEQTAVFSDKLESRVEKNSLKTIEDLPINSSKDQFVERLLPFAEKAAEALGVDAKVIIAQAALETGWGRAVIKNRQGESSYNLFNIKANKAWKGKQTRIATLEFEGGVAKKQMAGFRSYSSYEDSFNDYVNFIQSNPRYSKALTVVAKPEQYMHELQQAGYATDPNYANKVMKIYQSKTLSSAETTLQIAHNDAK